MSIEPGDKVRAVRGTRDPGLGQTGIVMRIRRFGRAEVRWTTLDVTTVSANTLTKIGDHT